jgi:hypothetical protein
MARHHSTGPSIARAMYPLARVQVEILHGGNFGRRARHHHDLNFLLLEYSTSDSVQAGHAFRIARRGTRDDGMRERR